MEKVTFHNPFVVAIKGKMWEAISAYCSDQKSGCYRLFVIDEEGTPIPIRRMLGDDPEGTLYIGASTNLPGRLANLKKGILASYGEEKYKRRDAHHAAPKLTSAALAMLGKTDGYRIQVYKGELTDQPEGKVHFVEEGRMLAAYHEKWGEDPPLNG